VANALTEARRRVAAGDRSDFLIETKGSRIVMNDLNVAAFLSASSLQ
jgi:hypothetical protein